jgi:excisionase family DNA binding protein
MVRHQQNDEEQFLYSVATWVVATQPQLYESDRELTEAQETARSFESLWYGELFYEPWVVQYRPGDSHPKVIVRRQSDQQKHGLRQALLHGDFNEHHRQAVLLRNRTKTVTLVGHRPLKVPPDVAARRRAAGEDPDAFKALIRDALRQREHQRFSSWEAGRFPKPTLFGHRKFDVPLLASVHETAVAIGLPLVQEGVLADDTVKPLLMTAMGVPASLVDSVWERLKLHYSDSQYPLSLKAYIKRIVDDLRPPRGDEVFQDESGTEYWTVQRAAEELGKEKTTIYRWIKNGVISQARFGVQKGDIERVKATNEFDHSVIALLCKARKIKVDSAERAYRRLCDELNIKTRAPIKSDEEKATILGALRTDPRLLSLRARWQPGVAPADEQEVVEGAVEDAVWADIHEGNMHLSETP